MDTDEFRFWKIVEDKSETHCDPLQFEDGTKGSALIIDTEGLGSTDTYACTVW